MINPATEIKKGLKTILSGNITYNSAAVPVYEGEGIKTIYQLLIKDISYTDRKAKTARFGRVSASFEVVTEEPGKENSQAADIITTSALELINPAAFGTSMTATGFQVTSMRTNIRPVIREQSGQGTTIIRRITELNFLINQINV